MKRLGLIGFGEAGYHLTKTLDQKQLPVFAFDQAALLNDNRAKMIESNARENHVQLVDSMETLISQCNIIFCLTSAASALPIARQVVPMLHSGYVYCDLNSTSPMIKQEIAALFDDSDADFVEAAIMASVPVNQTKVHIYLCGPKAHDLMTVLNAAGMNTELISEQFGAASAAKMLKSILFKGFIAILTETVFATDRYGITDVTLAALKHMMLEEMTYESCCNYFVETMAVHSERLSKEMEEVVHTLDAMGENSIMAKATMEKMRWMTAQGYSKKFLQRPNGYAEVLEYKRQLEESK